MLVLRIALAWVGAFPSPLREEGRWGPAQGNYSSRAGVNLLNLGSPKGLGKDGWELFCFACRTVGMPFLRKWGCGVGWRGGSHLCISDSSSLKI